MIGYAQKEVFTAHELKLCRQATILVDAAPYDLDNEPIRCHELARAVGEVLKLEHEDGLFGFVEHTWLWTAPRWIEEFSAPWVLPNVLDVYTPGSVPQVALVHMATGLPARYMLTSLNDLTIRNDVIAYLLKLFETVDVTTDTGADTLIP